MEPRIAPAREPYLPEVQATLERLPADWMPPFKLFTVLAREPELLQRFLRGVPNYLPKTRLTLRQREVLLHRVSANCGCRYEWGMRVHFFSQDAGLTPAQVRASVHGTAEAAVWEAEDHVLLRLADALHDDCDIGDALWTELKAVFSDEAILELLMLAGYYRMVAYIANGLRLPPEDKVCHPWPETESATKAASKAKPKKGNHMKKPAQKVPTPKQAAANKALLQWVFADLASGNGRTFLELLAEDVVWHVEGSTDWSRSYRGKAAVKADLLKPLHQVFDGPNLLTVSGMIAEADCVVVQARGNTRTRAGAAYCNSYCMIFRLVDGRVVEITEYADTALIDRVLPYPAAPMDEGGGVSAAAG